jgi:hypothetical protein
VAVTGEPHPALRGSVARYVGFREEAHEPLERREGPGCHVVVIVSFGGAIVGGAARRSVEVGRDSVFAGRLDKAPPRSPELD